MSNAGKDFEDEKLVSEEVESKHIRKLKWWYFATGRFVHNDAWYTDFKTSDIADVSKQNTEKGNPDELGEEDVCPNLKTKTYSRANCPTPPDCDEVEEKWGPAKLCINRVPSPDLTMYYVAAMTCVPTWFKCNKCLCGKMKNGHCKYKALSVDDDRMNVDCENPENLDLISFQDFEFKYFTAAPTGNPTSSPTISREPTKLPTRTPSAEPTLSAAPTKTPSPPPTKSPTISPVPSISPTSKPTPAPTVSFIPSKGPTYSPTHVPTTSPTISQAPSSSFSPSTKPSGNPSTSFRPSTNPTKSRLPSSSPTIKPSSQPTKSLMPTNTPSAAPSYPFWSYSTNATLVDAAQANKRANSEQATESSSKLPIPWEIVGFVICAAGISVIYVVVVYIRSISS